MEDAFNRLKKAGKHTSDGIVEWMKNANIIDTKNLTEEKVRDIFNSVGAKAKENIDLEKFKQGMSKVGQVTKENSDQIIKKLMDKGGFLDKAQEKAQQAATGVGNAAKAGVNAFKDAFK